jgi:hypothetical protein
MLYGVFAGIADEIGRRVFPSLGSGDLPGGLLNGAPKGVGGAKGAKFQGFSGFHRLAFRGKIGVRTMRSIGSVGGFRPDRAFFATLFKKD